MKALIEIWGNGGGMDIIPTFPRELQMHKDGYVIGVNMNALLENGFNTVVSLNGCFDYGITDFAGGSEVCLQVRKKNIFQKVKIKSNVPIKIYCEIGFFRSIIIIIKDFFGSKL